MWNGMENVTACRFIYLLSFVLLYSPFELSVQVQSRRKLYAWNLIVYFTCVVCVQNMTAVKFESVVERESNNAIDFYTHHAEWNNKKDTISPQIKRDF